MVCATQGGTLSPAMMQNMQGQDMDGYRKQLADIGMTPDDVMKKILSDPELAQVSCYAVLCYTVLCYAQTQLSAVTRHLNTIHVMPM